MTALEFHKGITVTLYFSVIRLEDGTLHGVHGNIGDPEKVVVWAMNLGPEGQCYIRYTINKVGEYTCDWANVPSEAQANICAYISKGKFTIRNY